VIVRRSAVCVAALLLAGCGAANPQVEQTPMPAVSPATGSPSSTPPAGVTLRDLGVEHGPAQLILPGGLEIDYQVDNPNNVTLVLDVSQGRSTYDFLRRSLRAGGFRITADGQQSLTFTGHGWDGAYTVSESVAGLTLRTG
jgi:hypothetical protein